MLYLSLSLSLLYNITLQNIPCIHLKHDISSQPSACTELLEHKVLSWENRNKVWTFLLKIQGKIIDLILIELVHRWISYLI